ncbi:MAG: hypothetical protein AB8B83_08715 [Bdellovibrionales bacterium]
MLKLDGVDTDQTPNPSQVFAEFIEHIRVARGYESQAAGARAVSMTAKKYNEFIFGRTKKKPVEQYITAFKDGFNMTPEERERCDALLFLHVPDCRNWPDVSITDEALLEIDNLPDFLDQRIQQMGKDAVKFAEKLGWKHRKLSELIKNNSPSFKLETSLIDAMANELMLSGKLRAKIVKLNDARPSARHVFAKGSSAQQIVPPGTPIKEAHLLGVTTMGDFLELAILRKNISRDALEQQCYPHKDFIYKITTGKLPYRLADELIHSMSEVLDLSAHERLHFLQLNANRKLAHRSVKVPDPMITKGHILATDSFTDCIRAKAIQQGSSIGQLVEACCKHEAFKGKEILVQDILTEGRTTRTDPLLLEIAADVLDMDYDERFHLLGLNTQMITFEQFLNKWNQRPVEKEELLSSPTLPRYVELKLMQQGISYGQFKYSVEEYLGRSIDIQKLVHNKRLTMSKEETQAMIAALSLDDTEALFVEFLGDIYEAPSEAVEAAQDEGNMLRAFMAYLCPEGLDLDALVQHPTMSKWSDMMPMYLEIGFPDANAFSLAQRVMGFSDEAFALMKDINAAQRSMVQTTDKDIESVYETTNLFDALMFKARQIGKGLNTLGVQMVRNNDYAAVLLSYGETPFLRREGAVALRRYGSDKTRGLDERGLDSMFRTLRITDLRERRYLSILNGIIWEKHRKKRFSLFSKDPAKRVCSEPLLSDLSFYSSVQQPAYSPFHDLIPVNDNRTRAPDVDVDARYTL